MLFYQELLHEHNTYVRSHLYSKMANLATLLHGGREKEARNSSGLSEKTFLSGKEERKQKENQLLDFLKVFFYCGVDCFFFRKKIYFFSWMFFFISKLAILIKLSIPRGS